MTDRRLPSEVHGEKKQGKGPKMQKSKFWLDKENSLLKEWSNTGSWLPKEAVETSALEILANQQEKNPSKYMQVQS